MQCSCFSTRVEERGWGKIHEPRHGGESDCTPGAELPDLPPSSLRRICQTATETYPRRTCQLRQQFSSRGTPAGAAGKLRPQFSSRSTPPELPDCRRRPDGFDGGQTTGDSSAVVRQLSSGSAIPFSSMSPPLDCRRIFGGSPAEKGILLSELSCRAVAEFPPAGAARLLVHKIITML
ncbi:unnamed protein product [Boreogadus saida]